MSDEPTIRRIWPIIVEAYGANAMSDSLAKHLAAKIDAWPDVKPMYGAETREEMIRHTCWNWFSGGSTAEYVAKRIEAVLEEAQSNVG
jgi:hypothetical protein